MPVWNRRFYVRFTSPDKRLQREVPRGSLASVSWEDDMDGGHTTFSVETNVTSQALPSVREGDIAWVYLFVDGEAELRFRGRITRRNFVVGGENKLSLQGEGLSTQIRRVVLDKQYLRAGNPDVSDIFSQVAYDSIATRYPVFIEAQNIGFAMGSLEAFAMPFGDAIQSILRVAGTRASWGVRCDRFPDNNGDYADTLELRRTPQLLEPPDIAYNVPSKSVEACETEVDASDIRNIIYLRGGPATFPNYINNADFRLIEFQGAQVNYLINPSFEELGGPFGEDPDDWTPNNGASMKTAGFSEGPAYHGRRMFELDNDTEEIVQVVDIPSPYLALQPHVFSTWMRRQLGSGTTTVRLRVECRVGGSYTQTDEQTFTVSVALWNQFSFTMTPPANTERIRVSARCISAGSGGVVVDQFEFYNNDTIRSRNWQVETGSGVEAEVLWTQSTLVRRSAYAPQFAIKNSTDNDASMANLNLRDGARFDVTPNQGLRLCVDVISPRTPNGGYYKNGKMNPRVDFYEEDGSIISNAGITISAGSGFSQWNQLTTTFNVPSNARTARFSWRFRGSASYSGGELTSLGLGSGENDYSRIIIGGISLRDAAAPEAPASQIVGIPTPQYEFIPDGNYQSVLRVDDVFGPLTAEGQSIDTYGESPYVESQEGLTDYQSFFAWAEGYFSVYATPRYNGTLTIREDYRYVRAGYGIRLSGPRGQPFTDRLMPLSRVSFTFDGTLSYNAPWGELRDDVYSVLSDWLLRKRATEGAGAGNGYYNAATSANLSSVTTGTGTSYWGTSARTGSDPTLHDAYAPANGPHVLSAERTAWDDTTAEVLAARASSEYGAYGSVDARLEAAEARLVVTAKIADDAVTSAKIATNAVGTTEIVDTSVTPAKLQDSGVTPGVYTNANIAVDAKGRVLAAMSGSGAAIDIEDDGVPQGSAVILDFASGITATVSGGVATISGSSGSGLPSRQVVTATTSSIGSGASEDLNIASVGKTCQVLIVETSAPAWVRFYSTTAYRTADVNRSIATDPQGEHGVLLESIHLAGNLVLDPSLNVSLYNLESTPATTIPIRVTNRSGVTQAITVTITVLIYEA